MSSSPEAAQSATSAAGERARHPWTDRPLVAVLRLGRPLVLLGPVMAHTLGMAMAYGHMGQFSWARAGMSLAILLAASAMAHYADEFADQDTDALTRRTRYSGGSGVLPAGLVPARWALYGARVCAALATGLTLWWVGVGALPAVVLPITALGMIGGWIYSMPPVALERRGWGEVANGLLGGLLMPLIAYAAQTGHVSLGVLAALLPATLGVWVNLLSVHWADHEADIAVGRRSIFVLAHTSPGAARLRLLYAGSAAAIYVTTLLLTPAVVPSAVALATLATIPVCAWAVATFLVRRSPLPGAALMSALFLAQSVGWAIAAPRL